MATTQDRSNHTTLKSKADGIPIHTWGSSKEVRSSQRT